MSDTTKGDAHLQLAQESLRGLLQDRRVPAEVREALSQDYQQIESMLEKLEHGHIHIAVFGRVSVGKSALLNALLGQARFSTSPVHGETRDVQMGEWQEYQTGGVFLLDTPGINEVDGEGREQLAHEVAGRSDLVLFVVDGDITETELVALRSLAKHNRPIILVLNKADRYRSEERQALISSLEQKTHDLIAPGNLVLTSADPPERLVIRVDAAGQESESLHRPEPQIVELKERLWDLLASEGKTLAALNASLFAGGLSQQVAERILAVKRGMGEKVIRTYCVAKGVAVAINPIPVADLIAAATVDLSMVIHLAKFYGFPLTRAEAGTLVKTIGAQMLLLTGTVWAVHLVSSTLKVGTSGLSTLITGGAQGAVAYYSTYIVGQAAERYLANGKSWGEVGPKLVVHDILDSISRDSILTQAREDIKKRLGTRA